MEFKALHFNALDDYHNSNLIIKHLQITWKNHFHF